MVINKIFDKLRKFDWLLLVAVVLLMVFGLSAIYSVSLGQDGASFSEFKKQVVFVVVGLGLLFFISFFNFSLFRVYSKQIYIITVILLVLVLFFGSTIRGTRGWFSIFGIGIQPVEIAKLALIIFLAKFFSNRFQHFFESKHILISGIGTLILAALVLLQPDFGSAGVLVFVWFILLILTGIKKRWLALMIGGLILVLIFSWFFFFQDYQKLRIQTFLNPDLDPLGSGYNVKQSMIAVGSGQFLGRGLGFGSQSQLKFIPESQTDFVFAVIAEELGFLGVTLVLGFWFIIFYRLIRIAQKAPDDFSMFLVLGIALLFFVHVLVNMGMNLGAMPVTGISLPFLSYGGSFLVICLFLIGIVESVKINS